MADEIKLTFNFDKVRARARDVKDFIVKGMVTLVNQTSVHLQNYIRNERFGPWPTGTTATTLSRRTQMLSRSVRAKPAKIEGDTVVGGVLIGNELTKRYTRVHFGKQGHVTVIHPKNAEYLRFPIMGQTFFKRGERAGQVKGKAVSSWVTTKEVKIPVRISEESLHAQAKIIYGQGLAKLRAEISSFAKAGNQP